MRWARPSTMAVLPTPGSPMSTGLFLVRRDSTCITRSISRSRPMTGSSFFSRASWVRLRPNWSSTSEPLGAASPLGPAPVPNGVELGGPEVVVMAGPCSVESREQLFTTAERSQKRARADCAAAHSSRARSPYSFQGMGEDGLKLLREAGDKFKLLVISEVMEISQIPLMLPYVDMFQVGARNMQNFNLLRELGKVRKPVLLKRGIAATFEELLLSAEYIMSGGNYESCFASAASALSKPTPATPWTSPPSPSSISSRICR